VRRRNACWFEHWFRNTWLDLNVSRGGIRAIVEDPLIQGIEYELLVGDQETAVGRRASVVWLQDESDGQIVASSTRVEDSVPPKDG